MSEKIVLKDKLGVQRDSTFKMIFSYKKTVAYLLKFIIPEFKGKTVDYVIECMNKCLTDEELKKSPYKIPTIENEIGVGNEKVTRYDVYFKVYDEKRSEYLQRIANIYIDLEMQNIVDENKLKYRIFDRINFYSARQVVSQLDVPDKNNYNLLDKTYSIWIIGKDSRLYNDKRAVHHFKLKDIEDYKLESNLELQNIIILELNKVNEEIDENLMSYLKAIFNGEEKELVKYFKESEWNIMKTEWNYAEETRREGIEEGIEKGLEKGREEGREEGLIEGVKKGKQQERILLINEMFKNGLSIENISKYLNIPLDNIEQYISLAK